MQLKRFGMQLPQYIIDLVGTLLDEGQDDNAICFAAINAWMEKKKCLAPNSVTIATQKFAFPKSSCNFADDELEIEGVIGKGVALLSP